MSSLSGANRIEASANGSPQAALGARHASLPDLMLSSQAREDEDCKEPSLAQLKDRRKRTELDAQLIANRVAYLRQEAERASKKIVATRTRAQELAELRTHEVKEKERERIERLTVIREKWAAVGEIHDRALLDHDREVAVRSSIRSAMLEHRHSEAQKTRESMRQMKEAQRAQDAAQRELLEARVKSLRGLTEDQRRAADELRVLKLAKAKSGYRMRCAGEARLIRRNSGQIARLQQEEAELLSWLQGTRPLQ
eukprot:CAMPEP_0170616470 /NCGR_PEP_ID=MMETSP0224-20130122/25887_1 /TAXON_ID=285029 /ORGANISM="Togula jolla, Strain CCCM 725" /LENGTH=253 /DNA_ID=CAMNT_0010942269 /DNA_START=24 /DNA_END=782 /DNA_ORIENTATION=+